MNPFDPLNMGLLDLLYELRNTNLRLIVGGGYGLYLKRQHIRQSRVRTLFALYPRERSTDLVMKLAAFRDREFDRNDPEQAMKHAFDLYPIVAMLTAEEYHLARRLGSEYKANEFALTAAGIVKEHFANVEARGMLRLREHPSFEKDFELTEFMKVLAEIFML